MYVCLCKGVTDTAIRRAVQSGVADFRSLRRETGLAGQCGKCACNAREIFNGAQLEMAPQTSLYAEAAQYFPAAANG